MSKSTESDSTITHVLRSVAVSAFLVIAVLVMTSPLRATQHGTERTVAVASKAAATSTTATTKGTDLAPDTTDEGQDVLMVRYSTAPAELWNALDEAGYKGIPEDDCTCFYVKVGTAVPAESATYVATYDGWSRCHGETCSPVSERATAPQHHRESTIAPHKPVAHSPGTSAPKRKGTHHKTAQPKRKATAVQPSTPPGHPAHA